MASTLPIEGYDTTREDGVTRIRPVYAAPLPVEAVSVHGQGFPQETPALPVERSGGILADVDRALSGAVRAPFDALDERLFGKSGKKGTYREAIQKFFKTGPSDEVKTGVNRLLGTGGEERYKTWPEKLVVDAITAPGNVLKSETPVSTEELIKPALDVSNLAGTGGLAGAGSGAGVALGSGPIRRFDLTTPSSGVKTTKIGPTEITYGVAKNGNDVELTLIKTDKNARGQGHGREALRQFIDEADANGKRVLLNADPMDKGTSKSGLVDFYKSMGFVRNKGKNKDFETRAEYFRNPALLSDNQPSVGIGAVSKSEKPFYSALERSLSSINQNKASGEQWLGMLANKGGVKPDELQWSGIGEFLAGKPSVTKAEIDSFLKENAFGVQEVVKGGRSKIDQAFALAKEHGWKRWEDIDASTQAKYLQRVSREAGDIPTKYHDYQLPGGENYREVLMTLPDKQKRLYEWEYFDPKTQQSKQFKTEAEAKAAAPEGAIVNQKEIAELNPSYKSSHWDEPNILAHMRMNDRTIDGKKSLHLEEIQSDWHQAGRKSGYTPKPEEIKRLEIDADAARKALEAVYTDMPERHRPTKDEMWSDIERVHKGKDPIFINPDSARALIDDYRTKFEAHEQATGGNVLIGRRGTVPDAPFKKNWHELALKRAIREAAENGYERLSWTPGEAQAARYDLSKHLNKLDVVPNPDRGVGAKTWWPTDKNNRNVGAIFTDKDGTITQAAREYGDVVGKNISDVIGKEIAEKGLAANKEINLTGLDLKIGGEGMKGFYDNIVPKTIEKLGKQFGVKVQTGKSGKDTIYYIDIPPAMRDKVLAEGFPLFSANIPVIDNDQAR